MTTGSTGLEDGVCKKKKKNWKQTCLCNLICWACFSSICVGPWFETGTWDVGREEIRPFTTPSSPCTYAGQGLPAFPVSTVSILNWAVVVVVFFPYPTHKIAGNPSFAETAEKAGTKTGDQRAPNLVPQVVVIPVEGKTVFGCWQQTDTWLTREWLYGFLSSASTRILAILEVVQPWLWHCHYCERT